jgi:hypothetical protein
MTPRLADLLARLEPVVREEMLKVAVPNCCVATVAVLCRVFKHHGFKPRALPVTVVIQNPKMVRLLASGARIPDDPEATRRWFKATGAHSIGIVPESALASRMRGYEAYGGHLLCHVQDVLVDASLDQASRPEHGIRIPPFMAVHATAPFLRGDGMLVGKVHGCEVQYRPLRDQSWRSAPDWIDERRYRETVNAILKRAGDGDTPP